MKRDENLIRKILLIMEASGETYEGLRDHFKVIDYTYDQVGYHCYLLYKEGLIEGIDVGCCGEGTSIYAYSPLGLTPAGHEYIEKISSDKNWLKKAKAFLKELNINIFSVNIN